MHKFKVGDKVKYHGDTVSTYTILYLFDGKQNGEPGYFVDASWGSHSILWHEDQMQLVKPDPKFKVGDYVLVTDETSQYTGKHGTVTYVMWASNPGEYHIVCKGELISGVESQFTKVDPPKFKVGDKAVLRNGTIITVYSVWWGSISDCWRYNDSCWYERDLALYVDQVRAPTFKVGDVVQLKSGGPKMTINDVDPEHETEQAYCEWFIGSLIQNEWFAFAQLVKAY